MQAQWRSFVGVLPASYRIPSYPKINRSEPIIVPLRVRVGLKQRIRDDGMPVGVLADDDQPTCGGGARGLQETAIMVKIMEDTSVP